jgi:hypothetical protein
MSLPRYSPDMNPIQQRFAKLKALLRKANERTIDNLWDRIGKILDEFSTRECANCLANSGYASIRSENAPGESEALSLSDRQCTAASTTALGDRNRRHVGRDGEARYGRIVP